MTPKEVVKEAVKEAAKLTAKKLGGIYRDVPERLKLEDVEEYPKKRLIILQLEHCHKFHLTGAEII